MYVCMYVRPPYTGVAKKMVSPVRTGPLKWRLSDLSCPDTTLQIETLFFATTV
jgi:hypothetical protein